MSALEKNETWDIVDLPLGKKVVGSKCKWVYTVKFQPSGEIERYKARHQRLVGKFRYLTITRPDITNTMGLVSQYIHALCQAHLHVVYRILRYLKGYLGKGMIYTNHGHGRVEIYSNADWGRSVEDSRSTSG
ncbi:uncharacterized mitochondrial protein AtMg00240-like [Nicotiana tomentosiformis]|uniref:uncharacterized mitochondrial protein AtMg00240-like n=1 Tax=Nicotiana tomentosiformis TaxID=4098 RepID=UPI00388C8102